MANIEDFTDYDKFKDNKNGAKVAMLLACVTAIVSIFKYGIDSLDDKGQNNSRPAMQSE